MLQPRLKLIGSSHHRPAALPMPTADTYRQKAEECVARAKAAISNAERARNFELAEHYMLLAMDELATPPSGDGATFRFFDIGRSRK
jgi:hypothetical protein